MRYKCKIIITTGKANSFNLFELNEYAFTRGALLVCQLHKNERAKT